MARFDHKQRVAEIKIVYCGPALSGKTTNVLRLHGLFPTRFIGQLDTLDTADERTLFFDYFPVRSAGVTEGYRLRINVFSVPGEARYRATRHLVLQGADGVIFVADSQESQLENNALAVQDLEANLKTYGQAIEDFPLVFQYNKRDLPGCLPADALERALNPRHQPYVESVAIEGKGVIQSFNALVELVKVSVARSLGTRNGKPGGVEDLVRGEAVPPPYRTAAEMVAQIGTLGEHSDAQVAKALERTAQAAQRYGGGDERAEFMARDPERVDALTGGSWDLVEVEQISGGRVRFLLTDSLMDDAQMEIWVQREQLAPLLGNRTPSMALPPEEERPPATPPLIFLVLVWLATITVWLILG